MKKLFWQLEVWKLLEGVINKLSSQICFQVLLYFSRSGKIKTLNNELWRNYVAIKEARFLKMTPGSVAILVSL